MFGPSTEKITKVNWLLQRDSSVDVSSVSPLSVQIWQTLRKKQNALVVMHQSIPAVPPRADPRELAFFENELANAPPPGQKSCSNAPG